MPLKQTKKEQNVIFKVVMPAGSQTLTGTVSPEQLAQAEAAPTPVLPQKPGSQFWGLRLVVLLLFLAGGVALAVVHDHELVLVWLLLSGMMVMGVIAALSSILKVRRAHEHFEKQQREADIFFSQQKQYASVRDRVHDEHFAAFLPGGAGGDSLPHRMHHIDRLKIILHIVQQEETEVTMPALDDLRAYSYSVEQSRWSNWVLRIVISVLLITGILGTLAGVHASMDSVRGGVVNPAQLSEAFLPSLVAVVGSIIMILLQAWYRYSFDAYMGKVDCHTLRYYFPWFRPDVLNEQSLNQFEASFGQLAVALERLGQGIALAQQIPQEMDKVRAEIQNMQELSRAYSSSTSVVAWLEALKALSQDASAQMESVLAQHSDWEGAVQQLFAATKLSVQSWHAAQRLQHEVQSSENELQQRKAQLNAMMLHLPDADALKETLQSLDAQLMGLVDAIAQNSNRLINERYWHDVEQAYISKEQIAQITYECQKLRDTVHSNAANYAAYSQELDEGYARSSEYLSHAQNTVEAYKDNFHKMQNQLEKRMVDYANEPVLSKWQVIALCAMGTALIINLSMTFILW